MRLNQDPSSQPRLLIGSGISQSGSRRIVSLVIPPEAAGQRLDIFLAAYTPSRRWAQRLIADGLVLIDGQPAKRASRRLTSGERLSFTLPSDRGETLSVEPEPIPLDIIFEDQYLAVINKPKGMVVHPGAGNTSGTLVNALLHRYGSSLSGHGGPERPGIVHRLDKDTSGCLIIARTDEVHQALADQLRARSMRRTYVALVHGIPPSEGTIRLPIGRHPINRLKMAVVSTGRPAITRFRLLESLGSYGLVQVDLETGRTHQIRVHLAHIGFPVVGDPLYGRGRPKIVSNGQVLHAWQVAFAHPIGHLQMSCVAPLPRYFAELLASLRAAT
ncbi:MAG: RluA family pseudouridine synthase [Firmicutes bacterium]|jgi:23S rRNA pseudouridine1911/1915/1917 synthase|nr:RluA family pseudouridine synthase [Bacillota bacterium]